ncbi:glycosyl hydrolase family 97 [Alteromonadaceae bacterium 2753L.S.0a.02]|nr:glycosyl hydrolase family 97 [Alteromonadaceae bacterium 2753L.S.0a.02]
MIHQPYWQIIAVFISVSVFAGNQAQRFVASPNQEIAVFTQIDSDGALFYSINYRGIEVIEPSRLGVVFKDANLEDRDFSNGLRLQRRSKITFHQEQYHLLHGKQREIKYLANEQTLTIQNTAGHKIQVIFRVSDDGVAFKYRLLGKPSEWVTFDRELTSFKFPKKSLAWLQPVAVAQTGWNHTNPSYEEHYQMGIPADRASPSPAGWVFPALFKVNETWIALTEAGMNGSYHASRLWPESPKGEYRLGLPMPAEVFTKGELLASGALPFESPWRIVALGDLATLVESTLGTDLADPAIVAEDFVKPGLASWSWALLKDDSVNFETQKQFIDFASEMHWPYTLVDVGWDTRIGRQKIAELVKYAKAKNVGLLLWYNSSGDWNTTSYTPKSVLLTEERRRNEFAWLQNIGVKGIKIDFFAGDGKSMMGYYNALAKDAADFGLVVNYHGSTLPRGMHRTYPNLLSMEAVHGFEMITFNQHSADVAPRHMAMLPFTRNLFDPMDFTPTAFSKIPGIQKRTHDSFELALPVLFLSGLQHIAETPEGMLKIPRAVKALLQDMPVVWDETRFVAGYPGDYVVLARRQDKTWYVAGINARKTPLNLMLNLGFIAQCQGVLITDDEHTRLAATSLRSGENFALSLKPSSGFVAKFK